MNQDQDEDGIENDIDTDEDDNLVDEANEDDNLADNDDENDAQDDEVECDLFVHHGLLPPLALWNRIKFRNGIERIRLTLIF